MTKRVDKSDMPKTEFGNPDQVEKDLKDYGHLINFSYLNANQNAFVRALMSNGRNTLQAYKTAYKNNMSDKAAEVQAYKTMHQPSIRLALSEIEKAAVGNLALSLEAHLQELASLRDKAALARQYSAAINAEVARGKASGLYVQRMELTGKDGAPLGITNVPLDEFKAAREKILNDC